MHQLVTTYTKSYWLSCTDEILSRRTDSKFNAIVLKRLFMSGNNRPPIGLARVARYMRGDEKKGKIAVVVGKVTDDARLLKCTKVDCMRIDLHRRSPCTYSEGWWRMPYLRPTCIEGTKGNNTVLLRGRLKARKSYRYFAGMGAKVPQTPTRTC